MEDPQFKRLGTPANVQVVQDLNRRFPGLLVQGDTLYSLLGALEEDAPGCYAAETLREWLLWYEGVLDDNGFEIPYYPRLKSDSP